MLQPSGPRVETICCTSGLRLPYCFLADRAIGDIRERIPVFSGQDQPAFTRQRFDRRAMLIRRRDHLPGAPIRQPAQHPGEP